jgi:hypothetical protein
MSDDASGIHETLSADHDPDGVPALGQPTRSASVARTLLLSALISMVVGVLGYQLGIGETVFDRPGTLALLFIDIAPVLWFAAAPILLHSLRWQSIDQRFRWVLLAALAAALISMVVRLTLYGEGWAAALLDPFTLAFAAWIAAAVAFTRSRVRRLARGTSAGITVTGIGLGFAVAGAGLALGALRLGIAGSPVPPGAVSRYITTSPTTGLLIAGTLLMIAGLFWLADRTRNHRR